NCNTTSGYTNCGAGIFGLTAAVQSQIVADRINYGNAFDYHTSAWRLDDNLREIRKLLYYESLSNCLKSNGRTDFSIDTNTPTCGSCRQGTSCGRAYCTAPAQVSRAVAHATDLMPTVLGYAAGTQGTQLSPALHDDPDGPAFNGRDLRAQVIQNGQAAAPEEL